MLKTIIKLNVTAGPGDISLYFAVMSDPFTAQVVI